MTILGAVFVLVGVVALCIAVKSATKDAFWSKVKESNKNLKMSRKGYVAYYAVTAIFIIGIGIFVMRGGGFSFGGASTDKCTICGKPATHEFQGSGYCNEHYTDAVIWSFRKAADKQKGN